MNRFYYPENLSTHKTITLTDRAEVHHLFDVLRYKKGDKLEIFNGLGEETIGIIELINKNNVTVQLEKIIKYNKPPISVTLACAVPKKSKFETIVEKATELGIDKIIPLKTERTEAAWKTEQDVKKNIRLNTVALNATKQSQRHFLPTIEPITSFKKVITNSQKTSTLIIPSLTDNPENILTVIPKIIITKPIIIFIGPEGDFTPKEYEFAFKSECIPVSLGPNILKVETAALCTVACIQQHIYSSKK